VAGDPGHRSNNRLSQKAIFRNGIYPLKMARGLPIQILTAD
jgi:hypothetical protein